LLKEEILGSLGEYVACVDSELSKLFQHDPATVLEKAAAESLSRGGKRVRAILALLNCELFSDDYKPAIPIAVAYELAHASALVQDDILDSSQLRRGEASIVAKYGLSNAILASNLLLFNVPKMMARLGENLESQTLSRLFDLLGEAWRAATWGEFLDLEMSLARDLASEVDYEEMVRSKTASLLAAPCASGAIVGGATDEEITLSYDYGKWLGMAYQILDDALDLSGDEKILGKPVFTDLRAGKENLVLIHCLSRCLDEDRDFLISLVGRVGTYTKEEVIRARSILEGGGSFRYARERSSSCVEKAKAAISKVSTSSRAKFLLLALSDYLAERYY
jgi:geranylgeranyl diphosphate synthase type I